ncbi:MmcQ/YjbR family DNA-binding protein [Tamlana sp. 62-3]|uniref:MmcQ/YjbR family DNA-binding protein n=1 Tax=Neotamlana sargassicola TaxID=2883125 RepID=A0A9X1I5A4_9FLAO|nr:MmcQ/YjbR family DNA-binding protein [Tamlana sargassicola]MCB4807583.1 MmcQ/YjbR family DNA-binding protein [Tamlana sargassicola]
MNIEQYRTYCLNKKAVTEHFPFDEDVLVFKVLGKMFALSSLKKWEEGLQSVNLKCDPDYALELRAEYEAVEPGYHMSKKHWNTIQLHKNEVPPALVKELIDQSYNLVVKSLPKKLQKELEN